MRRGRVGGCTGAARYVDPQATPTWLGYDVGRSKVGGCTPAFKNIRHLKMSIEKQRIGLERNSRLFP